MGIVIGVFIVVGIISLIRCLYNGFDDSIFSTSFLSICVIGLFVVITSIVIRTGSTATQELRLNTEATYNRLTQVIDNRMEIDANLLKEIYDYNIEIETKRVHQNSVMYWGTFPAIYDEFKLIDISELEKSVSDVDSSVRVKID